MFTDNSGQSIACKPPGYYLQRKKQQASDQPLGPIVSGYNPPVVAQQPTQVYILYIKYFYISLISESMLSIIISCYLGVTYNWYLGIFVLFVFSSKG